MRIVIFHNHFSAMGGAEILLATQARWLAGRGHDVRLATFQIDAGYAARHLDGLGVTEIGYPRGVRRAELLTLAQLPELVERTARGIGEADAVLAYNFPCAPVTAMAVKNARRVWYACEPSRALYQREGNPVTAARASSVGRGARDFATRQLARRMQRGRLRDTLLPWTARRVRELREVDRAGVAQLDGVVSLSQYGADCVQQATGRTDVDVIYPMVRFSNAVGRRMGMRRDAPQILVQTRIAVPKNLDTLIRGVARVRRIYPRATLHVVGSGGGREALEQIARETMPGDVRFHGFLPDDALDRLSAECDVFAFVPVDEPFGMVFPEAAARGLLMVGPDHGGPREILEGGAIGEMCNPYDPASVADAILRTLSLSDAEADQRRIDADASVRARFGPDVIGGQLEQFLRG